MASTVWRGFITFGLVSIPVRLIRAARAERISLRKLYRPEPSEAPPVPALTSARLADDDAAVATEREPARARRATDTEATFTPEPELAPVRQASVSAGAAQVLTANSVVKGYEYEKDHYVAIDPNELKSIAPKTATEMAIEEFVNLAEVDPVYFETSYYVVPQDAGEKAYALLYQSLQAAGLVAVAQFAMHSREHVVIIRPGGKGLIAHTMFFSSEVRADEEYMAKIGVVTPKELDLANMLIHSLASSFEPAKYKDSHSEKLEALIASRVAALPVAEPAANPSRSRAVVDIAEALQKSLAALKKPAASEDQPNSDVKGATRSRKRKTG